MELGLSNKLALVTGSSRGLGASIAKCLAREGARLILNSRNREDLDTTLSELHGQSLNHIALAVDLEKAEGPSQLVQTLVEKEIVPDIIVHNVGGNLFISDPLCSIEDWRKVQRVNLEIPIEINRELIPYLKKRGWGRICHVSSISALENQGPPSYCAAKAGLTAYSRSVGRLLAKDGIIINTILPGAVFTEGGYWDTTLKQNPEKVKKYLSDRMAIQRFGRPEEIGEVVAFLCSDLASFCVGSSFLVDGGQGKVFQES